MNAPRPIVTEIEPSEETLISARQIVLQAILAGAERQIITLDNLTLHGLELGSWTITVTRIE